MTISRDCNLLDTVNGSEYSPGPILVSAWIYIRIYTRAIENKINIIIIEINVTIIKFYYTVAAI